ncbi:MAG: thiamine-phosphate kinase [Bacteroidales bacterium]|nr:thiamine-phosphate kinase [Bacteroidales bacterium]
MAEESFKEYGKEEAISLLYEGSGFARVGNPSFEPAPGSDVVWSSRLFVEGIDFDLTYFPLKHLGYKCASAVAGEICAMMAHPKSLLIRLGVSAKLDFSHIRDLWSGVVSATKEHGFKAVDLDLVPSPNGLTVSVSAGGERLKLTRGRTVKARSKDLVCVSGSLGAAYLGQQILEREKRKFEKGTDDSEQPDLEKYKMLIGSYLKPEIPAGAVARLEETGIYPSNGYLVSHGLSDALKRLVRDSGLGVKVYADKIPFEGNSFAFGKEMDIDPISAAMNGGDDFRLLFTIPILSAEKFRREFQTFEIIGHMAQPEVGAVLVTPDGVELPVKAQGWNDDHDLDVVD